jgi:hypothetical protein
MLSHQPRVERHLMYSMCYVPLHVYLGPRYLARAIQVDRPLAADERHYTITRKTRALRCSLVFYLVAELGATCRDVASRDPRPLTPALYGYGHASSPSKRFVPKLPFLRICTPIPLLPTRHGDRDLGYFEEKRSSIFTRNSSRLHGLG